MDSVSSWTVCKIMEKTILLCAVYKQMNTNFHSCVLQLLMHDYTIILCGIIIILFISLITKYTHTSEFISYLNNNI